jgi:ribosomal protein S18 acetylase RimI-like enzyme
MPPRVRPPDPAEAPAVLDLIVARDVADIGAPDFTLDDVKADWATPGVSLQDDARVAAEGDAIRGYAILLGDDAVVLVHPDAEGRGTGTVLRRWAEARAAERGTAVLRQFTAGGNDGARKHLRAAGYEPVQHYFRLRADLADVAQPSADGLRPFRPEDEAHVHALIQDAFSEIEGNQAQTLEQWRTKGLAKPSHDPGLWLLADDEEGVVGAALGERWEGEVGYVTELAVDRRARGRGLGRTLLLGAFAAFREAGLRYAELSVHGRNRGALALYESVGMRTTWEAERWEKALGRG